MTGFDIKAGPRIHSKLILCALIVAAYPNAAWPAILFSNDTSGLPGGGGDVVVGDTGIGSLTVDDSDADDTLTKTSMASLASRLAATARSLLPGPSPVGQIVVLSWWAMRVPARSMSQAAAWLPLVD